MICRRTESNDILLELVAKTLAVGAYEMQVEYEDRKEHVFEWSERTQRHQISQALRAPGTNPFWSDG